MNPLQENSVSKLYDDLVHAAMAEGHSAVGYQYTTLTQDIPAGTEVAVLVVRVDDSGSEFPDSLPVAIIPPNEEPEGLVPMIEPPTGEVHQGIGVDLGRRAIAELIEHLPPDLADIVRDPEWFQQLVEEVFNHGGELPPDLSDINDCLTELAHTPGSAFRELLDLQGIAPDIDDEVENELMDLDVVAEAERILREEEDLPGFYL